MSQAITNTASITYNNQPAQQVCPVLTVVEPNMSVHKFATTDTGRTDSTGTIGKQRKVVYDILLTNHSSKDFTNVVITDKLTLPSSVPIASVTYVTAESKFPNTGTLPQIILNVGTVPAKSSMLINYTLQFADSVPLGTAVSNTASVNYTENTTLDDETAEVVPIHSNSIALTLTYTDTTIAANKTGPSSVLCNQPFDYVLTFSNTGGAVATGVSVSDALPENFHVNSISVKNGTKTLSKGVDYNYTTGANPLVITSIGTGLNIAPSANLVVTINGMFPC